MMTSILLSPYSEEVRDVIQSVFLDLIEIYLKEVSDVEYSSREPEVDFPYSKATAHIVIHIGKFFRPCFQDVFDATLPIPCRGVKRFVKYALSLSEAFLREDYPRLLQGTGPSGFHFVRFLLMLTFLAELLYYCIQKNCFRHLNTIPKCMLIAYDRWLESPIEEIGGLSTIIKYCDIVKPIYESFPVATSYKVMGFHGLSQEVKEIEQKIKDCIENYNLVVTLLTPPEKELLGEDETKKLSPDRNCILCEICDWGCKTFLHSFICSQEEEEEEDSDPSSEGSITDHD